MQFTPALARTLDPPNADCTDEKENLSKVLRRQQTRTAPRSKRTRNEPPPRILTSRPLQLKKHRAQHTRLALVNIPIDTKHNILCVVFRAI